MCLLLSDATVSLWKLPEPVRSCRFRAVHCKRCYKAHRVFSPSGNCKLQQQCCLSAASFKKRASFCCVVLSKLDSNRMDLCFLSQWAVFFALAQMKRVTMSREGIRIESAECEPTRQEHAQCLHLRGFASLPATKLMKKRSVKQAGRQAVGTRVRPATTSRMIFDLLLNSHSSRTADALTGTRRAEILLICFSWWAQLC